MQSLIQFLVVSGNSPFCAHSSPYPSIKAKEAFYTCEQVDINRLLITKISKTFCTKNSNEHYLTYQSNRCNG